MKFTKRNFFISGLIVLAAVLFQLIQQKSIHWVELSNTLFLMALPILIIGLFGLVLSAGTFDFFHFSMRQAAKRRKKAADQEETEDLNPHALSSAVGESYRSLLTIGTLILLASILCLWDYLL